MVCLFTVPLYNKVQTYSEGVFPTQCSSTPADDLPVSVASPHPIAQGSTYAPDAEKRITITEVFNHKDTLTLFHAEDDQDDADIFREAITQIDPHIKLYSVDTGHALCELLKLVQPDMIFLDLDMPDKNGLECIAEIRSNVLYKTLPIVVYSSTTRPSNIHTAYEIGADLFLIKPYVFNELLTSLKAILHLNWQAPATVKDQHFINNSYRAFM